MNTPEGAHLGGLHVLTDAELNRYVEQRINEPRAEDAVSHYALLRRQATYRRSAAKRYARYSDLCTTFGLPRRADWPRLLPDLERRAGLR